MSSENTVPPVELQVELDASPEKLDLREFCGELYRKLRAKRISGFAQAVARMNTLKRRNRVRLANPRFDSKPLETYKDSRGQTYARLGNGMIVKQTAPGGAS